MVWWRRRPAGVFETRKEQKIAGETPAPRKAKSLREGTKKRETMEIPVMIIYKFVRMVVNTL